MTEITTNLSFDTTQLYLGSLCKKGHEFNNTGQSLRRLCSGHCRDCESVRRKIAYHANIGRSREINKQKHQKYHEKRLAHNRRYNQQHREEQRAKARVRYYATPNRLQIIHEKRQRNLEQNRKASREAKQRERQNDPEGVRSRARDYYRRNRLKIRLRNRLLKALNAYTSTGKILTASEYGVDFEAILKHLGPRPGGGHEWHIDHIRPLASFNLDDPDQVKEAFAPENHQWLPARENISKGAKYAI